MSDQKSENENDNLRSAYDASVDYHNNLVQLQFTLAGLVFVANGFIVSEFLQPGKKPMLTNNIPMFGMVLSVIFLLLNKRTKQLLDNIGSRGLSIEKKLGFKKSKGFFSLMKKQPLMPKIPFTKKSFPKNWFFKCLFSHSFLLNLLYIGFILFWGYMLITFDNACY